MPAEHLMKVWNLIYLLKSNNVIIAPADKEIFSQNKIKKNNDNKKSYFFPKTYVESPTTALPMSACPQNTILGRNKKNLNLDSPLIWSYDTFMFSFRLYFQG